ncbi:hypothetical protein K9B33_22520, partial [Sphingobium sp. 3R8]|uniref:SbtR family transcriptional regulator n=1 Tax=Sphingobium sp. 3R8 TaxID=2874921 RepID=UPI001CC8FFA2
MSPINGEYIVRRAASVANPTGSGFKIDEQRRMRMMSARAPGRQPWSIPEGHFPNKDALLAALLVLHYENLDQRRVEIEGSDPGRTLELWIEALGDWMLAYEGLPEPLRAACRVEYPLTPTCDAVIATTEKILKAAQDKGFARRTMTGRNIFFGALAVAWASGATAAKEDIRNGLREV